MKTLPTNYIMITMNNILVYHAWKGIPNRNVFVIEFPFKKRKTKKEKRGKIEEIDDGTHRITEEIKSVW